MLVVYRVVENRQKRYPPVTISFLFTHVMSFLTNQLAVFSRAVKQLWFFRLLLHCEPFIYQEENYMDTWRYEISLLMLKIFHSFTALIREIVFIVRREISYLRARPCNILYLIKVFSFLTKCSPLDF